jgi:glycosyltransferase involved in cell wall biosynthesis
MRVLLVAPVCDGHAVGESRIAFEWARRLAERHDVTVLSYHQKVGTPLAPQLPRAQVVEWPEPPLVSRFPRFNSMFNPGYPVFYGRVRHWLRTSSAHDHFDVAHQVVPVSVRYPSPLTGSGIPYVIGPVGGSLASPPAFVAEEGGAPWYTRLRAIDGFRLRHDPRLRRSFAEAGAVLGIAGYVGELLQPIALRDFQEMSDTGIDVLPEAAQRSERTGGVRLLFVGRLVRTKGLRDAVRAIAQLPRGMVTLDVVGVGDDGDICRDLARSLGVGDDVRFHGWVPHERVLDFFRTADVFLFPSYREAGGIVVTEAMAAGLPVIVCDAGGPASTVTTECGIRVAAHDPAQYARDLATAITTLAQHPARRAAMGEAARRRIAETSLWDLRIAKVDDIYAGLAGWRRTT